MTHPPMLARRELLHLLAVSALAALVPMALPATSHLERRRGPHPTPRRDYTAEKVLTADQLGGDKELITLFDGIRKIPQVVDGVRCSCGCADLPGFYSLLSCFEGKDAMAKWCAICAGTGALVIRLHGRGRTLDQIREAVDARY